MTDVSTISKSSTPVWLWPNLLGLDAPLVAVSWQLLFARCFGVSLPPIIHLILGLSVWCIYLADRLYDAKRAQSFSNTTPRLTFTKDHFKVLVMAASVAGFVNLILILRVVPSSLLVHGLGTAAILAFYYVFRFSSSEKLASLIPREITCGMVFAIGSAISTFSYGRLETTDFRFLGAVAMLGLVCSASCILISVWERDSDINAGDRSISSEKPGVPTSIRRLLPPLVLLYVVVAFFDPWQIHVSAGLSALALYFLVRFEKETSPILLRVLADGVLLTPLLLLPFS